MPLQQIVVLAVIQGITEFLPISSSGHLALVDRLSGWPQQGLDIDVAVHVGTLGAVLIYFWRDIGTIAASLVTRRKRERRAGRALARHIVISAVPVVIAGAAVAALAPEIFRDVEIIAWATIGFAVVLYVTDRFNMTVRRVEHMTNGHAVIFGLAQVLALIPGTSRSGITMSAGRALGYERGDAARFSMLMSIPVIIAAGAHSGYAIARDAEAIAAADAALAATDAAIAAGLSFLIALAAIVGLMHLLRRVSFTPFVIYRLLLGGGLLVWWYGLV